MTFQYCLQSDFVLHFTFCLLTSTWTDQTVQKCDSVHYITKYVILEVCFKKSSLFSLSEFPKWGSITIILHTMIPFLHITIHIIQKIRIHVCKNVIMTSCLSVWTLSSCDLTCSTGTTLHFTFYSHWYLLHWLFDWLIDFILIYCFVSNIFWRQSGFTSGFCLTITLKTSSHYSPLPLLSQQYNS
jgi:hypothetical protein